MRMRRERGGTAALIAVIALVLIIVGFGFFALTMFFGGERQLKNASDAGALNVAKEMATDFVTPLVGTDEGKFADVLGYSADLTKINRVWAKTLLIALNAHAMNEGQDNVNKLYTAAQTLTTRLALQVRNPENRKKYYVTYARNNPLTMLGPQSKLDVSDLSGWSHAYLDEGEESNVTITAGQRPLNLSADIKIPTLPADKKDPKRAFLVGYKPYEVAGKKYWQVPFKYNERPALVSPNEFEIKGRVPPAWLPVPLPNAFSAVGKSKNNAGLIQTAKSWAQTNPDKTYQAAIPDGFVRVVLEPPTYDINIMFFNYKDGKAPGFKPWRTNFRVPKWPPWKAVMYEMICGNASVNQSFGNEYIAPTVLPAVMGLPPFRKSQAFANVLQRVQQINPDCNTNKKLERTLLLCPISTAAKQQTFYICNIPNPSKDGLYGTSPKLVCAPEELYRTLKDKQPDGQRKYQEKETALLTNFGLISYQCALPPLGPLKIPTITKTQTTRIWQPGTGYTRCLGTLTVQKHTRVDVLYVPCVCWPP